MKRKTKNILNIWSGGTIELSLDTIVYLTTVNRYNEIKVHEIKVQDLKENIAYISRFEAIYGTKESIERHNKTTGY
jgi:hypothetical protein